MASKLKAAKVAKIIKVNMPAKVVKTAKIKLKKETPKEIEKSMSGGLKIRVPKAQINSPKPGKVPPNILAKLNSIEADWLPAEGIAGVTGHLPKFVVAQQEMDRLLIRLFRKTTDNSLRARVWFGPLCEGPPGTAHGGSVAAVLDEAMGQAGWLAGWPVVAAHIKVNFKKMLPLLEVVTVEARVVRKIDRKVYIKARLIGSDNILYAESKGLFILMDIKKHSDIFSKIKGRGTNFNTISK
jgi:acyl-coenzyme A thioesterase PaaI-like protein